MKPRTDFETIRANELLVKRATEGLDATEAEELAALGSDTDETIEEAAAIVDLATLRYEPMPSDLVDKVLAAALPPLSVSSTAPAVPAVSLRTDNVPVVTAPRAPERRSSPRRRTQLLLVSGWATALAAVAAALYLGLAKQEAPPPAPAASHSDIDATTDTRSWAWSGSAGGTIVWSKQRQRGYATIAGLPKNDPAIARYQLWIFDGARDERYPVDGGLFDVTGEQTTVDIAPRIRVDQAAGFMVTREQPSGVVVSDRAHVLATTK